jgi:hypothetical protein
VSLSGTLKVAAGSGYVPQAGAITILSDPGGTISGNFVTFALPTISGFAFSESISADGHSVLLNVATAPPFMITTTSLPAATFNQPYSLSLTATGGSGNPANYFWSATGLPSFLTLSTAGVISGTPTLVGTFSGIAVTVTDTSTMQTASMTYSLTVNYSPVSYNYVSTADSFQFSGGAYFRLEALSGNSEVSAHSTGAYTYTSTGATVTGGAPIGVTPTSNALALNGTTGGISTTYSGGINNSGSIVAWVNLSALPSASGKILYIAGESQVGNDFDLQLTSDNYLRFYTTNSGANIGYPLNTTNLVGQWHMVAATFSNTLGQRALYVDGVQVGTDTVISTPGKTTTFNIGATPVFSGRNFTGSIDEAAVYSIALSPTQVQQHAAQLRARGGRGTDAWHDHPDLRAEPGVADYTADNHSAAHDGQRNFGHHRRHSGSALLRERRPD